MIDNRFDYTAKLEADGLIVTDHLYPGMNRQVPPGTYAPDWDAGAVDSVTFPGAAGDDTLMGGGGEFVAFFVGTRGDDLYGGGNALGDDEAYYEGVADYSGAKGPVVIDMTCTGSRTFTDETGAERTVSILGRAVKDGFGGQDDFIEGGGAFSGYSSVTAVIGSRFADRMEGSTFSGFFGGAGNDRLTGNYLNGGDGNDILAGRAPDGDSVLIYGDDGDDRIYGTDGPGRTDIYLVGGEGDDRIYAGAGDDRWVTGNAGDDFIDGGDGDDFIDGGIGRDRLVSGAGNDTINPDKEFFFPPVSDPNPTRDGDRDVVYVTEEDLGDFYDVVQSRAFEEDLDVIRFREAVRGGADFRVYEEAQSFNDATGRLLQSNDMADRANTVLEIDWNRDGFGADDYFLYVVDASLSLHGGYMLT